MGEILRRCGDDLTRANVLKQATTLAGFHSPYFLDGVNFELHPDDYTPMTDAVRLDRMARTGIVSDKPVTECRACSPATSRPLAHAARRFGGRPCDPGR